MPSEYEDKPGRSETESRDAILVIIQDRPEEVVTESTGILSIFDDDDDPPTSESVTKRGGGPKPSSGGAYASSPEGA